MTPKFQKPATTFITIVTLGIDQNTYKPFIENSGQVKSCLPVWRGVATVSGVGHTVRGTVRTPLGMHSNIVGYVLRRMNPQGRNAETWSPDGIAEFMRIPPGTKVPSIHTNTGPKAVPEGAERLGATLDDYHNIFAQRARQMFSGRPSISVPPGHPLYSQNATLDMLREDNARLQKENARLRESADKSRQPRTDRFGQA